MASQVKVDELRKAASEITSQPIDELVANRDWGTINFEAARKSLTLLFGLCAQIQQLPIELMPDGPMSNLSSALDQARQVVARIRNFSLVGGNPVQARDATVAEINSLAEAVLVQFQGWVGFLAYQSGDVQRNVQSLNDAVAQANAMMAKAKEDADESKIELASIVAAAREASASAGVGVFTADFRDQAVELEKAAKTWLTLTAAAALLTIVASVASAFIHLDRDAPYAQVIQFMTSKLLALGVLASATAWCGRIYKATKHQAALSDHRAKALKTFQAFAKATNDDVTRDAVLLETTRSIFAIAPTGYLDSADASADTGSKMLEVVKAAAPK
jgi:hypothetical protein